MSGSRKHRSVWWFVAVFLRVGVALFSGCEKGVLRVIAGGLRSCRWTCTVVGNGKRGLRWCVTRLKALHYFFFFVEIEYVQASCVVTSGFLTVR